MTPAAGETRHGLDRTPAQPYRHCRHPRWFGPRCSTAGPHDARSGLEGGDRLALRIPNALAQTLGVKARRSVELRVEDGRLIVVPIDEKPTYRLEDLLDGMSPDGPQDEPFSGHAVGDELF